MILLWVSDENKVKKSIFKLFQQAGFEEVECMQGSHTFHHLALITTLQASSRQVVTLKDFARTNDTWGCSGNTSGIQDVEETQTPFW